VRKEVLSDDRVLEVEQAREGAEHLARRRPLDALQELVGKRAYPVAVRRRGRVDRERRGGHGLEVAEREARAEEGRARLDDGARQAVPPALRPLVDLAGGVVRQDEARGEAAEPQELLDGVGEELLMLGVVGRAVRADEEVLDEPQRKLDRLVRVDKVLEDDGRLRERR